MLIDEIARIADDPKNLIANLQACRPEIKELIYFTYCTYEIDLPTGELDSLGPVISPQNPPMDILRQESPKLLHLFVKEFNPNLTKERRIKIFGDILNYATKREKALLVQSVRDRQIPGINKDVVLEALGRRFLDKREAPFNGTWNPANPLNSPRRKPVCDRFIELKVVVASEVVGPKQ